MTAIATHSAARCCSPPESSPSAWPSRGPRGRRARAARSPAAGLLAAHAREARPERDPGADRLVVAERLARVLRDGGDGVARCAASSRGFGLVQPRPVHVQLAGSDRLQAGQARQQRRLPRAARAHHRDELAGLRLQRRALQRDHVPGRRLVDDEQLARVDRRAQPRSLPRVSPRKARRAWIAAAGVVTGRRAAPRRSRRPRELGHQLRQRAAAVGAEREQVGEAVREHGAAEHARGEAGGGGGDGDRDHLGAERSRRDADRLELGLLSPAVARGARDGEARGGERDQGAEARRGCAGRRSRRGSAGRVAARARPRRGAARGPRRA